MSKMALVSEAAAPCEPDMSTYRVLEAVTREHKETVWELHRQKVAFVNEHEHIKARIFDNEDGNVQCRSWLLEVASYDASKPSFLAAVTVRLNPYMRKEGFAWAQVMNISVSGERRGYGTRLIAGLEELLQRECIDTVVLYPVHNNRATTFWTSLGYEEQQTSFLPPEELDPKNGALLPEGCKENGKKFLLPRWEKKLTVNSRHPFFYELRYRIELDDGTFREIDTKDEFSWKLLKREHWPLWRKVVAKCSKLTADEVSRRFELAQRVKNELKKRAQDKSLQLGSCESCSEESLIALP